MASAASLELFGFIVLWLHVLSCCQGKKWYFEFGYPFIYKASNFSAFGKVRYDYIVVGGGTAGCPLAATLSQNYSVLLLERGGVPFSNANVSFLKNFHITLADTSATSASQFFASTDGVLNSRARVLGGGTSINAGFYTRANPRFVKKVGWEGKMVNESYEWVERQIVHMPKIAPWQVALRDGLLGIGVSPFNGFTYDHVYGTKFGGTIFDRFGRRHTAAELLESADPQRLTVLIHATVKNVIIRASGKKKKAVGVFFKDEDGKEHKAFLSKHQRSEVILSCGAIGTPHLLLLSGIGPKPELVKMNISVVVDNPSVGEGMVDNPMNSIFVPTKKPVELSLIQAVGITKKGVFFEASSGFGQSPDSIRCNHGIMSAEIGQLSAIPPKQRTREVMKVYTDNKKDVPHEAFNGGFILEKIAKPVSRGKLVLSNTNIDDNPLVTFNYFSHPRDVRRCMEGVRLATKIAQSDHFKNLSQCDKQTMDKILNVSVTANVNLIPKHLNDTTSLAQFCKDTVVTIWHYHGGCHVGKVVGPDYKVLGVRRLRVVDGSTFSQSPGTNPQATVLMMGRYMGQKILRDRLSQKKIV